MAKSLKVKRKSTKRSVRKNTPERGIFSKKLLFILGILLILSTGIFVWKPWESFNLPLISKPIEISKPKPNYALARQMTIDPTKDTVMQIIDSEKVFITIEIPKGALKEKTVVKMIPFYYDKNASSPTAGVLISPSSVTFSRPVTLAFDFSQSKFSNTSAPKNLKTMTLRATGKAQVMQIDEKATTLTPMLIARAVETERYLPARILHGGAYVYSLTGDHQVSIAKKAFSGKELNSLIIMEAASALVFNGQKLTDQELTQTKSALKKILSKKEPPAVELYAAVSLQEKLKKLASRTFIKKAHADTSSGYFEFMCKQQDLSVTDYLTTAKTAQLLGFDEIGENCMIAARNIVAEEASKVLENPDSDLKSVLIALQRMQILGVDDDSNLDESLMNRAKVIVTKEAQAVLADTNASAVDIAKALQKVQLIGAANGSVEPALQSRLEAHINSDEAKNLPPEVYDEEHEDLIPEFDMNVVGLAMAQALFGLETFDEAGIKAFSEKMANEARAMGEMGGAFCHLGAELGADMPPECADIQEKAEQAARDIEQEGYRAGDEVGNVQDDEYDDEDYGGEDIGEDSLDEASWMFYDYLTGTPVPEEEYNDEVYGEEVYEDEVYGEELYDDEVYGEEVPEE